MASLLELEEECAFLRKPGETLDLPLDEEFRSGALVEVAKKASAGRSDGTYIYITKTNYRNQIAAHAECRQQQP